MLALLLAVAMTTSPTEAFYTKVDDMLVRMFNEPGLATRLAKKEKCPTPASSPTCAAIVRGVFLDQHRAAVVSQVTNFGLDHGIHVPSPPSCSSYKTYTVISVAQEFGCALIEHRWRVENHL